MATVTLHSNSSGRAAELTLLAFAIAIGFGGFSLIQITMVGTWSPAYWWYLGGSVLAALAVHLVMRHFAPYADPVLLPSAVALNGLGLAMIHRLDLSYLADGTISSPVLIRQVITSVAGVILMLLVVALLRDHRSIRRFTYTAMVVAFVLLLLPALPIIGQEINGARIWISLGFTTFQPSELAKIALAIFFAGYLVSRRDNLSLGGKQILGLRLPRLRDLGPLLLVWGLSLAVLVLQRDLGTSLLLFGLFVAMLYVATNQVSWLAIGFVLFAPAAYVASKLFSHVGDRFDIWIHAMDPEIYNRNPGGSWQLVQGLFGMANGGLMGAGWGAGYPQLVTYANSDFVMASLAEELGLTGALAILLIYLILVERGMRVAIGVRDGFGKLLAAGLAFTIALQVFVVVGGLTRVIPLTGLTLPFIAAGGSSLISNWIILGILIRISNSARAPSRPAEPISTAEIDSVLAASATSAATPVHGVPRARRRRLETSGGTR
ncbi:MAG: FtsW/RodA/SpoVE family cell cycle protein [Varibaculum sp.]|nr:FtsW/RodA/SpoVE family cell cycle protein [Varibaculum sp.]